MSMKDFFISYNSKDKEWAEWVAWQLEEAGYITIIQAWDFRPGGNFVIDMQLAAEQAKRTIAVLSQNYLDAVYTQPEWAAAFAQDPTGLQKTLLPVRIQECNLKGMLSQIVYIDLVGKSEDEARELLLTGLKTGRAKPNAAPNFPQGQSDSPKQASEPPFPGADAGSGRFSSATEREAIVGDIVHGDKRVINIGGGTYQEKVDTGGGNFIRGNIDTGGGDFIGGDQNIYQGDFIGGDQITYQSPPPLSAKELLTQAETFLENRDYSELRKICRKIFADGKMPENMAEANKITARVNLLMAIALLRGQGANQLNPKNIERIETHLLSATKYQYFEVMSWAMLGIVKYDYYILNGLSSRGVTVEDIAQKLQAAGGPSAVDIARLETYIDASWDALEFFGLD